MKPYRVILGSACILLFGLVFALRASAAPTFNFVVSSTADTPDVHPGDGICADSNSRCTLRAAIMEANADAGTITITFNVGAGGVQTIAPSNPLPPVESPLTIDGTSEPGCTKYPCIVLQGINIVPLTNGLTIGAGNTTVRGLVISQFNGNGIQLDTNGGNTIQGNDIGTDVSGTLSLGNGQNGVEVNGTANNVIGGTTGSARNVISGNGAGGVNLHGAGATGNVVEGNYIGTDVTGTKALTATAGPHIAGVLIQGAVNNVIGGTTAGARNLISGNSYVGVEIRSSATGNQVQGNYIGTDVTGMLALGNSGSGVFITDAPSNTVGGATADAGNVISGNSGPGIILSQSTLVETSANVVQGNLIGTDATGTHALGNTTDGIGIAAMNNIIGGTTQGAGNVISGNGGHGIKLQSVAAGGNVIQGNEIGTDTGGTLALGNGGAGILAKDASNNTIGGLATGAANLIAFNAGNGVTIGTSATDASMNNAIRANSIFSNGKLGIDLANDGVTSLVPGGPQTGPNALQNYPVLTSAVSGTGAGTTIQGQLSSTPNTSFALDFFSNAACDGSKHGEGQTFLESTTVVTDGSGNASFNLNAAFVLAGDQQITATTTDPNGNSSEFSSCLALVALSTPTPTSTATTTPVATNTPTPTSTPAVIISSDNLNVQYGGWRGAADTHASGGTYRVSNVKYDKVTFSFKGTSFAWLTLKGPDQGKAKVMIDGMTRAILDQYSSSTVYHVQYTFKGLGNQKHTVVVQVLGQRNTNASGYNVALDAFLSGGLTTEDSSNDIRYDSWRAGSDPSANGSSYRYSGIKNALVSFTFGGTSINWITALGPQYGKADVMIDGQDQGVVDLFAPTQQWQVVKTYAGLTAARHTLQIKALGTSNLKSKGKTVVVEGFSGPITTTGTAAPSSPESPDASSWWFGLISLGVGALGALRWHF